MFHAENEVVRSLLFKGCFGLEKESLRVNPDGTFAHTLHPFPDDSNLVYDFCENQTEINTEVAGSAKEVLELLKFYTGKIHKKLADLPTPELLWPFSNPPYIKNERDIPIARHNVKAEYNEGYREYLANRYGRYKMALCGIHVNFSFDDSLLKADFALGDFTDFNEYKNEQYLSLAEGLAAAGWIITALTAASPLLDGSYFEKGKEGTTVFNGMSSTRCSELGYWNYFTPVFDYSNIRAYAKSIQRYVDEGYVAAPTELYYPIRLKSYGKNDLKRLHDKGVSHIELRMVDLNPLTDAGMDLRDLEFIHLLLIWIMCRPRKHLEPCDQIQAAQNFKNAAHYDLKTVKIVVPNAMAGNDGANSVADEGLKILSLMKEFFHDYPEPVQEILDFEETKLLDPDTRYSWMLRKEYEEHFVEKGLQLAKKLQKKLI